MIGIKVKYNTPDKYKYIVVLINNAYFPFDFHFL